MARQHRRPVGRNPRGRLDQAAIVLRRHRPVPLEEAPCLPTFGGRVQQTRDHGEHGAHRPDERRHANHLDGGAAGREPHPLGPRREEKQRDGEMHESQVNGAGGHGRQAAPS